MALGKYGWNSSTGSVPVIGTSFLTEFKDEKPKRFKAIKIGLLLYYTYWPYVFVYKLLIFVYIVCCWNIFEIYFISRAEIFQFPWNSLISHSFLYKTEFTSFLVFLSASPSVSTPLSLSVSLTLRLFIFLFSPLCISRVLSRVVICHRFKITVGEWFESFSYN